MATTMTIGGNSVEYQIDNYYLDNGSSDGTNGNWVMRNDEYGPAYWQIRPVPRVHDIQKEEVKDMRGLFRVVVVAYKDGKILFDDLLIAKDGETARIKALAEFVKDYDLDDLDVICNKLGDVRKKREVTRVKVVSDE